MSINTLRREWTSSGGDMLAGMTRAPAHLTQAIDSRAVPFSGRPSFGAAAVDRHGECGGQAGPGGPSGWADGQCGIGLQVPLGPHDTPLHHYNRDIPWKLK